MTPADLLGLVRGLKKNPLQEAREGIAEGTRLGTATHGMALGRHMAMLDATARRTEDAHQMQLRSLGFDEGPAPGSHKGEDMAGDVKVQGDTYNFTMPLEKEQPAAEPSVGPHPSGATSSALKWAWPLLLAGATGLAGYAISEAMKPDTPAANTDTWGPLDISTGKLEGE